ncbi:hypothetical protein [Elstera sp.]|jgi:hypothetical protein|uniref:hypothetical protein n=1 Tax=Elstera sp. TaxID=1916664 RepID=UPI0037BF03DA
MSQNFVRLPAQLITGLTQFLAFSMQHHALASAEMMGDPAARAQHDSAFSAARGGLEQIRDALANPPQEPVAGPDVGDLFRFNGARSSGFWPSLASAYPSEISGIDATKVYVVERATRLEPPVYVLCSPKSPLEFQVFATLEEAAAALARRAPPEAEADAAPVESAPAPGGADAVVEDDTAVAG